MVTFSPLSRACQSSTTVWFIYAGALSLLHFSFTPDLLSAQAQDVERHSFHFLTNLLGATAASVFSFSLHLDSLRELLLSPHLG